MLSFILVQPNILQLGVYFMFVKGIKKGKNIELLEEVDLPDNQEVMVEIKKVSNFWSALQEFRQKVDLESLNVRLHLV